MLNKKTLSFGIENKPPPVLIFHMATLDPLVQLSRELCHRSSRVLSAKHIGSEAGIRQRVKGVRFQTWLDWEQIVVADPDVVLVHPCGLDVVRTLQEMPLLEHRPGWYELKAVQRDRIFVADGNQSTARGLASSKVWKCWLRSFTPSYSLPATKGKVGYAMQLSQESRERDRNSPDWRGFGSRTSGAIRRCLCHG